MAFRRAGQREAVAPDVIFGAISLGASTDHTYHCLGTFELSRKSQGDKRAGYRPGSHAAADSADVTSRGRLQVKTSDVPETRVGIYGLSRRQLREIKANELFFMFMLRWADRWRFILIRRDKLAEIRDSFERPDGSRRRGRPPTSDVDAKTDALTLKIEWGDADAVGWGVSLGQYLDQWPDTFPPNPDGPGAVKASAP